MQKINIKYLQITIVTLFALIECSHSFGLTQSARVTGRLTCGDVPASNAKVVIVDKDTG
jgi:hypothetical protein